MTSLPKTDTTILLLIELLLSRFTYMQCQEVLFPRLIEKVHCKNNDEGFNLIDSSLKDPCYLGEKYIRNLIEAMVFN